MDTKLVRIHIKKIFFWPYNVACGILVLQPGIKLMPPGLEAWCLKHWTTKEFPRNHIFLMLSPLYLGSISGLGRTPGKGRGYPFQYSWASQVAQMVKNPPTMQETWVWSPGWEDPLKEGTGTHCSILAWRIPKDRGSWQATVHGVTKSRKQLND